MEKGTDEKKGLKGKKKRTKKIIFRVHRLFGKECFRGSRTEESL